MLDCAKFGSFATLSSVTYKLFLCSLRRLGCTDDRINAPIAGFLSAFSLAIEAKSRKQLFMILMMSRCADCSISLLEEKEIIPKFHKYKYLFIFLVCNLFLLSSMGMKQELLNNGMRKFYAKWSRITVNDQHLCDLYSKMLENNVPTF